MDIGGVTVFGGSLPPSALSGVGRPAPSGVEVIETDHIDGATIAEMKAVLKSKGVKSTYSTRDEYLKAIKTAKVKFKTSARAIAADKEQKQKAKAEAKSVDQKRKDEEKKKEKKRKADEKGAEKLLKEKEKALLKAAKEVDRAEAKLSAKRQKR